MSIQFTDYWRTVQDFVGKRARLLLWIAVASVLLSIHAASVVRFGPSGNGPFLSALILLAEGLSCAVACYGASRRSGSVGRYFWRLITLSFVIWIVAELVGAVKPSSELEDLFFALST